MDYLLDTHTLLWLIFDSDRLSSVAHEIILDRNNRKHISISTIWEISIKNRIGKLPLPDGLVPIFSEIEMNGFGIVEISRPCIEVYNKLPLLHRDPFDGIIIATAILGNMEIVTTDKNIQKYDVRWKW